MRTHAMLNTQLDLFFSCCVYALNKLQTWVFYDKKLFVSGEQHVCENDK